MVRGRIYNTYERPLELAEVNKDTIMDKTRFTFDNDDQIIIFAKVKKPNFRSGYGYIIVSESTGESITLDSQWIDFNNAEDRYKIPEIELLSK
jgi:hypothetical protein